MKLYNKDKTNISRGYCGYVTKYDGTKLYLRSKLEFIIYSYLNFLSKSYPHIEFTVEEFYNEIYLDGKFYRPDFNIYKNGKLWYVVEVKYDKSVAQIYLERYVDVIKNMLGAKYIVVYEERLFNKITEKLNLHNEIEKFKIDSIYDYSGANNPHYGMKLSQEQKNRIGVKTKERHTNKEYKDKFKKIMKERMADVNTRRLISDKRKEFSKRVREEKNINDPIIQYKCEVCGTLMFKPKSVIDKTKSKRKPILCGYSCVYTYYKSINNDEKTKYQKISSLLIRIKKEYNLIISNIGYFDRDLAIEKGLVNKHTPCSISTILKYYITNQKEIYMGNVDFNNIKKEYIDG